MNENRRTLIYVAAAIVLLLIAIVAAPGRITPSAFTDQGEPFFPNFEDPNTVATLEIAEFDSSTGEVKPFKVGFKNNRWTIPSHNDYPADAKDRMAKTAAGIIGIVKNDFRSDNPADYTVCGVIDPLDETAADLTGRGQRVTMKDASDNILADVIIGRPVEGRPGFRFIRLPGQKRVYAVKTDANISTRFEDWIDTDLLQVEKNKINRVILWDYSIDERTRRIVDRDKVILTRKDKNWSVDKMTSGQMIDSTTMDEFLRAIDNLSIVGVRPKPVGITRNLQQDNSTGVNTTDLLSLQSKGFFLTREGELKSNEGELTIRADDGVVYTLRFGEVLYGSGLAVTAGTEEGQPGEGSAESRYLFITTGFDPSVIPEPGRPTDMSFQEKADSLLTEAEREQKKIFEKHEEWKKKIDEGDLRSKRLSARFGEWYYVISADSFEKLHKSRKDLVVSKTKS